jgi:hypothetical protein
MFRDFTLRIVAAREYLQLDAVHQRQMLPSAPGIYVWTMDLRLAMHPEDQTPGYISGRVNAALHPTTRKRFQGRIEPYSTVSLHDDPPRLTASGLQRLAEIEAMNATDAEWALLCPTLFQRPLYVGKAGNLRTRLRSHLAGKSKLVAHLASVDLTLNDCAIVLAEMTPAPADDDDDNGNEFEEEPEEPAAAPDDDPLEGLDDETETLIRTAESLIIRMGRPLLNERMD